MPKTVPPAADVPSVVTIEAILAVAQIDRRTLNRWIVAGLIPKPQLVPGLSGRGKRGVWDQWVPERARKIKDMHGRGIALNKIADTLRREIVEQDNALQTIADTAAQKWFEAGSADQWARGADAMMGRKRRDRRGRAIKPPTGARLIDVYETMIEVLAAKQGLTAKFSRQIAKLAADKPQVDAAVGAYIRGFTPVLLWDGQRVAVLPDFVVSSLFSHQYLATLAKRDSPESSPAYLVINLWDVLTRLGAALPRGISGSGLSHPHVFPAIKVWEIHDGFPLMEYEYKMVATGPHVTDLSVTVLMHTGTPLSSDIQQKDVSGK